MPTIPNAATRKAVEDLTVQDISACPVWVYVYDEENFDETTVKPVRASSLPKGRDRYFVATQYFLANGASYLGVAEIEPRAGVVDEVWGGKRDFPVMPQFLFAGSKQVYLPSIPEDDSGKMSLVEGFKRPIAELLPAWYQIQVPIDGVGIVEGVIWP